ncbi:unnamed protein product [Neospora caninum Liverpool]|uniref:Toxoplasma gondii family A protein n=1 Tax=Neospora caninum (strain Liverpool) TaxID=572307 RepID=F0VRI6_NEOCL|nr:uncharacterized protein NCLIV_067590 [Neospora caninum Liverpool]CBZ56334.1 unnamed protein product [Neospora caninum Liverpool]CEL71094.1 TPA: hypothetical protein BN1204_067590 [Neospora caninum Liverpool]|eukprot:XP_003886359.1 uncharacterized protein NCLIV_067590 [Neospora caninum Liverpool]
MEGQLFRAVCLTLLMGTVLSCAASETSQKKAEADFTTTIPKEGLERDVEQVFYLGPSSTLQVIDETGKAKYLPEPSTTSDDALSEQYSVAYRFENGTCDFTQTLVFNDAFPGYTKPLWVPDKSGSAETEGAPSGGRVRYTFTTPPEEYLGGGLSFCVRFKTVLASGSESQTSTSTTATSVTSGETTKPGEHGNPKPDANPESGSSSEGSLGSSQPQPGHGAGVDDGDGLEEEAGVLDVPHLGGSSAVSSHNDTLIPSPDPPVLDKNQSMRAGLALSPTTESGLDINSVSTAKQNGARLRRLSEHFVESDAFLTIVVHSAAWRFAGGMSALSVCLLTVAVILVAIS